MFRGKIEFPAPWLETTLTWLCWTRPEFRMPWSEKSFMGKLTRCSLRLLWGELLRFPPAKHQQLTNPRCRPGLVPWFLQASNFLLWFAPQVLATPRSWMLGGWVWKKGGDPDRKWRFHRGGDRQMPRAAYRVPRPSRSESLSAIPFPPTKTAESNYQHHPFVCVSVRFGNCSGNEPSAFVLAWHRKNTAVLTAPLPLRTLAPRCP